MPCLLLIPAKDPTRAGETKSVFVVAVRPDPQ
nr:MAG TPA_asm: hypothetical protein [Caudoviricetes sp.]